MKSKRNISLAPALLFAISTFISFKTAWAVDHSVERHDVKVIANGAIMPLSTQRHLVLRALGKPGKNIESPYECASAFDVQEPVRAYYYGKTEIEIHGAEAFFRKVDLTDRRFRLMIDGVILDNQTTLSFLQRRYQEGVADRGGFFPLYFELLHEDSRLYLGISPSTKKLTAFYIWMEC